MQFIRSNLDTLDKIHISKYVVAEVLTHAEQLLHRSDSIQGTDYIATSIQGFLGQKMKI